MEMGLPPRDSKVAQTKEEFVWTDWVNSPQVCTSYRELSRTFRPRT